MELKPSFDYFYCFIIITIYYYLQEIFQNCRMLFQCKIHSEWSLYYFRVIEEQCLHITSSSADILKQSLKTWSKLLGFQNKI